MAILVIAIVPATAITWWLVSPLFVSKTVDEEFPFAFGAEIPPDMTISEVENAIAIAAKVNNQVDEAMPDMRGPIANAPIPTPTATNSPVPFPTPIPSPTPQIQSVDQQIASDIRNFMLEDLTVEVGTAIVWTNQDRTSHTTTAGSHGNITGEWDSGSLIQGKSHSFAFHEVGDFPYFCKIHPDMQGIVHVTSKQGPTETPALQPTSTPVPTASPTPMPSPSPEPTATQAPLEPLKLKEGSFRDADRAHRGSGQATIFQGPDGSFLLRLENFNVTNGPDLRVLLSPHPNPDSRAEVKTSGYVEIGKLKGNKGNQNYPIPDTVDVSAIESVIIYCKPFKVIFSVASLKVVG